MGKQAKWYEPIHKVSRVDSYISCIIVWYTLLYLCFRLLIQLYTIGLWWFRINKVSYFYNAKSSALSTSTIGIIFTSMLILTNDCFFYSSLHWFHQILLSSVRPSTSTTVYKVSIAFIDNNHRFTCLLFLFSTWMFARYPVRRCSARRGHICFCFLFVCSSGILFRSMKCISRMG